MKLDLDTITAEALRRKLWDWYLDDEDRAALDALSALVGDPEQRPADRVPEFRRPEVQAAVRAEGADDQAIRRLLRGSLG